MVANEGANAPGTLCWERRGRLPVIHTILMPNINVVGWQQARAAHMTTFATIVGTKTTPIKAVPIQKVGQARRKIK